MEAESGRPIARLKRELRERPYEFEFFQAMRLLEMAGAAAAAEDRNAPATGALGGDTRPDKEVARLRVSPTLTFSPSAIHAVDEVDTRDAAFAPLEVTVPFLGATGPLGVLPRHYSELIAARLQAKDSSLADFLDLFHHRALSFFYRAWRKYRLPFAFEHDHTTTGGDDDMSAALHALVGLGTPGLLEQVGAQSRSWIYYAGYFSRAKRTALGLESMLTELLSVDVRVEQFVGSWIDLAEPERSTLGGGASLGEHSRLGESAVLGDKVWDLQSKIRIHGGPMSFDDFRRLRPGAPKLAQVSALTREYLGPKIAFEFEWELRREEIPASRLASDEESEVRLGWTSWLAADRPERYASKVAFSMDN